MTGPELFDAFPQAMRKEHAAAIRAHRLAMRSSPRRSPAATFQPARPGVAARPYGRRRRIAAPSGLPHSWWPNACSTSIASGLNRRRKVPETVRIELPWIAAASVCSHRSDILRAAGGESSVSALERQAGARRSQDRRRGNQLIRAEVRNEVAARRDRLIGLGASEDIVRGLVRLYELDGVFASLRSRTARSSKLAVTRAYTKLGEGLGLDLAQQQVAASCLPTRWSAFLPRGCRVTLSSSGIDFLTRLRGKHPEASVERSIEDQQQRIAQFRQLISRAGRRAT